MSILSHTWGVGLMDDYRSIVVWWSARGKTKEIRKDNPTTSATRNVTESHRDLTRSNALKTTRLTHW